MLLFDILTYLSHFSTLKLKYPKKNKYGKIKTNKQKRAK